MIRFLKYSSLPLALLVMIAGCGDNPSDSVPEPDFIADAAVTVNPSGYAPLTALIVLQLEREARVTVWVAGKNGDDSDIVHAFDETGQELEIPVLGLYPGYENTVELTFYSPAGENLGVKSWSIQTSLLLADLPAITIDAADRPRMEEGLTFVSYFGHNGNFNPQRPFMFDTYGDIRWYLDYRNHPDLANLFYDDGMERLENGNLYFGDGNSGRIYEIDMLGEVINTWDMPGYGFHHQALEKPDGNFIVTVNKNGESTIEDYLIEIDREANRIINIWNLNESLDNTRSAWPHNSVDWIHVNGIAYDESDDTIIISGRTQGVIKLTENNEVVWILAPHKGWGVSGSGGDLTQYLLQPLDSDGQPITDQAVLNGDENHPDFEWNWYQHAPLVMPDGNVMLFDNGDNRNYGGEIDPYSRAVEYDIDVSNMTVRQVWSYGKERSGATYSRIVSDVDYLPESNHVLFSPGAVNFNGANYGKSIELDYAGRQVIFEATITPPTAPFNITFHRTERMSIYQ